MSNWATIVHTPRDEKTWVDKLDHEVRLCRSNSVRIGRSKLLRLTMLTRLALKLIKEVDQGNLESARLHLKSFVDTIEKQSDTTVANPVNPEDKSK